MNSNIQHIADTFGQQDGWWWAKSYSCLPTAARATADMVAEFEAGRRAVIGEDHSDRAIALYDAAFRRGYQSYRDQW